MPKKAAKTRKSAGTSKSQQIVGLLKRSNGASIPELVKATSWQAQSIRSFMSGTLKTKMGLQITSDRADGRQGPPLPDRGGLVLACHTIHSAGDVAPDTKIGRHVLEEIRKLESLSFTELKQEWLELSGKEPPRFAKRSLLTQMLACEIQARAFGGVKPSLHRQLLEMKPLSRATRSGQASAACSPSDTP